MPTIQQEIVEAFLKQLAESDQISALKIDKLRAALGAAKTPKAEAFVRIFDEPDEGDIA